MRTVGADGQFVSSACGGSQRRIVECRSPYFSSRRLHCCTTSHRVVLTFLPAAVNHRGSTRRTKRRRSEIHGSAKHVIKHHETGRHPDAMNLALFIRFGEFVHGQFRANNNRDRGTKKGGGASDRPDNNLTRANSRIFPRDPERTGEKGEQDRIGLFDDLQGLRNWAVGRNETEAGQGRGRVARGEPA